MAVVFTMVFFAVFYSGLRDIRQTIQVDGRVQNVWQSEVKDTSGVLRAHREAIVGYRFDGVDYTAQVSLQDRVLKIGDTVPVFINPRSPKRAELMKPSIAGLTGSSLLVGAIFLLLPLAVGYGIYRWLGKIQVEAYLGSTPPPDRFSFAKPPYDGAREGSAGVAHGGVDADSGEGIQERFKSWLIVVSPVFGVIFFVAASLSMGWKMSSFQVLLAMIAAMVLQHLIRRRRKRAISSVSGSKPAADVRPPEVPSPRPSPRFAWPWSENPYPWLIGTGVVFLLSGAMIGYNSIQGKLRGDRIVAGQNVRGSVVHLVRARDVPEGSLLNHVYPVIAYDIDGHAYRYKSRKEFPSGRFRVGDAVELLVNPRDHEEAAIDTSDRGDAYHGVTWIVPIVAAFLGWAVLRKGLEMRRNGPHKTGPAGKGPPS